MRRTLLAGALAALGILPTGGTAYAHDERPVAPVSGNGHIPTYRTTGPTRLVCKTDHAAFEGIIAGYPADLKATNEALWTECQRKGYRDLQTAVDSVTTAGVNIKVLPGVYQELPS